MAVKQLLKRGFVTGKDDIDQLTVGPFGKHARLSGRRFVVQRYKCLILKCRLETSHSLQIFTVRRD
jgi:hypothetical protein